MTNFTPLRYLLEHCSEILAESRKLFGSAADGSFQRWHTSIRSLIDDPNTFYGVSESNPSPVLESIALAGIQGIAAIELGDDDQLQAASKNLSSAAQ